MRAPTTTFRAVPLLTLELRASEFAPVNRVESTSDTTGERVLISLTCTVQGFESGAAYASTPCVLVIPDTCTRRVPDTPAETSRSETPPLMVVCAVASTAADRTAKMTFIYLPLGLGS